MFFYIGNAEACVIYSYMITKAKGILMVIQYLYPRTKFETNLVLRRQELPSSLYFIRNLVLVSTSNTILAPQLFSYTPSLFWFSLFLLLLSQFRPSPCPTQDTTPFLKASLNLLENLDFEWDLRFYMDLEFGLRLVKFTIW